MLRTNVKRWQGFMQQLWLTLGQREVLLALVAVVAIGIIFWAISKPMLYILHQGDLARTWIKSFGLWAPFVYMSLFALQIIIAPMPGQFLGVMGGYVFGIFFGAIYSITALTIGAGVAMVVARRLGRPALARFFAEDQLRLWERKLYMRSPVNWGLLFVFPVPDFVFYLAGLSSIPLIRLVPSVIVGRSIGLIFASIAGGLTAYLPPEWVLVKWAFLLIVGILLYRHERKLRFYLLLSVRRLERWLKRGQQQWTTIDLYKLKLRLSPTRAKPDNGSCS